MKAYVVGHKTDQVEGWLLDIQFGSQPTSECRYVSRPLAEIDCSNLNKYVVCSGQHRCAFAVDELPDGSFGIMCVCHPFAAIRQQEAAPAGRPNLTST